MYNPFSLCGKTILITGASSGIGRSTAIECSKMGALIIITARNEERLKETLSLMEGEGHRIIIADISEKSNIEAMVQSISTPINGIVHCAGLTIPKLFHFVKNEEMKTIMAVNFEAPAIITQLLIKQKMLVKSSSIIFISSISGIYCSYIAGSFYSASKGAINGLVKGLALELAPRNIRVNCINPAMVDTNILTGSVITEEQLHEDMKKYPLKRYGKPDEVAFAAIYLLSDASRWVTGTNLLIDGGYTLQ